MVIVCYVVSWAAAHFRIHRDRHGLDRERLRPLDDILILVAVLTVIDIVSLFRGAAAHFRLCRVRRGLDRERLHPVHRYLYPCRSPCGVFVSLRCFVGQLPIFGRYLAASPPAGGRAAVLGTIPRTLTTSPTSTATGPSRSPLEFRAVAARSSPKLHRAQRTSLNPLDERPRRENIGARDDLSEASAR